MNMVIVSDSYEGSLIKFNNIKFLRGEKTNE